MRKHKDRCPRCGKKTNTFTAGVCNECFNTPSKQEKRKGRRNRNKARKEGFYMMYTNPERYEELRAKVVAPPPNPNAKGQGD